MTAAAQVEPVSERHPPRDRDVFVPRAGEDFVITPEVEKICARARAYFRAGYPVHLAGPSGAGKTTLAFHLASELDRPAVLMQGNHEMGSSDLLGANTGYRRSRVVDNFIHTVLKTEEEMRQFWVENRLVKACRNGFTLIYDEFNRSKPEANNVLLSVLEEKILNLPAASDKGYVRVHPDFRAIFTSNPEEYAGTHRTQDALLDRMITIRLRPLSKDTEIAIASQRSGLDAERIEKIQLLISKIREQDKLPQRPSIRTMIALSRIVAEQDLPTRDDHPLFMSICEDIILSAAHSLSASDYEVLRKALYKAAKEIF